jgi:hypothetical protein
MGKLGAKGFQIALLLVCLVSLGTIPGRRAVLARSAEHAAGTLLTEGTPPAPARYVRFDRISAADGLSFSLTTSILQDQQGFMWFGTRYGLNKYDGFNFTIYVLESSEDVLFSNYVRGLYQDRTGDLWVSTLADLVRMDSETQ